MLAFVFCSVRSFFSAFLSSSLFRLNCVFKSFMDISFTFRFLSSIRSVASRSDESIGSPMAIASAANFKASESTVLSTGSKKIPPVGGRSISGRDSSSIQWITCCSGGTELRIAKLDRLIGAGAKMVLGCDFVTRFVGASSTKSSAFGRLIPRLGAVSPIDGIISIGSGLLVMGGGGTENCAF